MYEEPALSSTPGCRLRAVTDMPRRLEGMPGHAGDGGAAGCGRRTR